MKGCLVLLLISIVCSGRSFSVLYSFKIKKSAKDLGYADAAGRYIAEELNDQIGALKIK